MFKTLIILYARSFWVTECTPNPGRSFPHWRAPMIKTICKPAGRFLNYLKPLLYIRRGNFEIKECY